MSFVISSRGMSTITSLATDVDKSRNNNGILDAEEHKLFEQKIEEGIASGEITLDEYKKYLHSEIRTTEGFMNYRLSTENRYKEKNSFKNVARVTLGTGGFMAGLLKFLKFTKSFKTAGLAGGAIGLAMTGVYLLENKIYENKAKNEAQEFQNEIDHLKSLYKERFGEEYTA